MPAYSVKNNTSARLFLPLPIKKSLVGYGTMIVEHPAADMENTILKDMEHRGLITIGAFNDPNVSDDLEVPVVSMIEDLAGVVEYNEVTSDYLATIGDTFIAVDASAGPVNITFFAASLQKGKKLHVKKIDSTSNAVTVTPSGGDLIDGHPNFQWNTPYAGFIFVADGVDKWWVT